jgi:hypothetical protein
MAYLFDRRMTRQSVAPNMAGLLRQSSRLNRPLQGFIAALQIFIAALRRLRSSSRSSAPNKRFA